MRRILAALPLIVLATMAHAAGKWITFPDPDGAFNVSVPSQPTVSADSVDNTDGNKVAMTEYTIDHDTSALMVIVSDLTRYPNADPVTVLNGAANGAKGSAAQVLSDAPSTRDGLSGREVRMVDKDGNFIQDEIYFFDHKLYQIMYVLPAKPTAEQSADAKHFSRGFHFIIH